MRRFATNAFRLSCLLLLFGFAAGTAVAQGIGPVNTNGSFEATEPGEYGPGYDIDGWLIEVGTGVATPPIFEVIELADAPDGDQALRVLVTGAVSGDAWDIQIVADSIAVIPGERYSMSLWARSENPSGTASFTVGRYNYNEYARIGSQALTTEWREYTLSFTITDSETFIRVPLHFNFASNLDNAVYIDNLRVMRTSVGDEEATPVIVDAESGVVGAEFDVIEEGGTTFVRATSDWQDEEWEGDGTRPVSDEHVVTYEVTFPSAGTYNLFARVRVNTQDDQGRNAANNDSFFYGTELGDRDVTDASQWSFINQIDNAAGFESPEDVVHERGGAGAGVWKWLNISANTYGNAGVTFSVPEGDLTQTFQIGGRETFLDIDKLAFGLAGLYYTVANLDNGEPGSIDWPVHTDPVEFYEGPPLAEGHDKYLGNIYSPSQAAATPPLFENYWNQVAPENEGKWGSVQTSANPDPSTWNWAPLDNAYNLAKSNDWPFRFHVLVWGSQQPGFLDGLSDEEQLAAVRNWFQAVADRYQDIDRLEVVNEPLHAPPSYARALGGAGDTNWDWIITAFEMAREIFPETPLMINDFGILTGGTNLTRYTTIINLLKERDLIDAIGVQGHHFTMQNITAQTLRNSLDALAGTGLPVVITELDVAGRATGDENVNDPAYPAEDSDQNQLQIYQRIFPVIWSHPGVEGVTLWGWKLGGWRPGRQMNLVRSDGSERPALTWMREYLAAYGTSSTQPEIAGEFELHGNYPNPFNPTTQITYQLSTSADVRLDVFDMLGRHVRTLSSGHQSAGEYTVTFDAGGLASGVYLYRLQTGSQAQTKRMLLIK